MRLNLFKWWREWINSRIEAKLNLLLEDICRPVLPPPPPPLAHVLFMADNGYHDGVSIRVIGDEWVTLRPNRPSDVFTIAIMTDPERVSVRTIMVGNIPLSIGVPVVVGRDITPGIEIRVNLWLVP